MAHHKSAIKRIRSDEAKRLRNKYYLKTTRTFIKKLRKATAKEEAEELYKKVSGMLDKLAKRNIIHKNNASNKKASLHKVMSAVQ